MVMMMAMVLIPMMMMMLMFFFSYGGDCLNELGDRKRLHYPETGLI